MTGPTVSVNPGKAGEPRFLDFSTADPIMRGNSNDPNYLAKQLSLVAVVKLSASKLAFVGLCTACLLGSAFGQPPKLMEVELPKGHFVGMPIHWSSVDAVLLEPDGRFQHFDTASIERHRVLSEFFRPQTLAEARSELQAELGPRFETLIAGPYVIAAPTGEAQRWQTRFTTLLSGYTRYFEVRGLSLRRPSFPLVVVVLPSREDFVRYCRTHSNEIPAQVVGSYFPKSNRCVLYQIPGIGGTDWAETEATIVHEAVHQLAHNTGVHERLSENPTWFVEGLATMFEQPAVYDSSLNRSSIETRMHAGKVRDLQPLLRNPALLEAHVAGLITDDALFSRSGLTAYALGWAMTFYLSERMPNELQKFLKLQASRPYGRYTADQRAQDFEAAFRTNPGMLSTQMIRLYAK